MFRKKLLSVVVVLIAMFCVSQNVLANSWHTWTQSVRNQAIVNKTYPDNNQYVAKSCKEWVRDIVYKASSGLVTIPPTSNNLYTWIPDNNVVGRSALIQYAQPGEIVQMLLSSGIEHTAIVLAVSPTGITFIESNWGSDEVVHTRFVTFAKFKKQVRSYSIYYIL